MRATLESIYGWTLRLQGGYILAVSALFFGTFHLGMAQNLFLTIPAVLALVSALTGLVMVRRQWQPRWFGRPSGFIEALGPIIILTVTPLLFVVPSMAAIVNLGLPEPLSQHIAVGTAAINFLLSGFAWWLAVALMILRRPDDPPPVPRPAPSRPAGEDLRALRHSRMAHRA